MTPLLRLMPEELDAEMARLGQPRFRADQLLRAAWREGAQAIEEIAVLPKSLRATLAEEGFSLELPGLVRSVVSEDGETTKVLLRMESGTLIETVLMQYPEGGGAHPRSTVCVSTQAGCAMGCIFCATGQMGFERNLQAEEIVAQVLHMSAVLRGRGEHVTNIVFMGMGEPLANYAETVRAVRLLTHTRAFGLGQRHITISTVGLLRAIDRLADEGLQVGLAISLHSPDDALRQQLVPTAGLRSATNLISAARRYFRKTGRRVTFEYALIAGVNDSAALAGSLARLLQGMGAHVNLIPVNPTAGDFGRPERPAVIEFERILRDGGVNCTVRVEKGSEISAACGQLRTDEEGGASEGSAGPLHGRRQAASAQGPSQSQ